MLSIGLLLVALAVSSPVLGDVVEADLEAAALSIPDGLTISESMSNFCINLTVGVKGTGVRLLEGDTIQTQLQIIGEGYLHLRSQTLNFSVTYIEHKTRAGVKDGTSFSAVGTTFSTLLGTWACPRVRLLCLEILSGPKIEDKNKKNNWVCVDVRERMRCSTTPKPIPSCKIPSFPEFVKRPTDTYANINESIVFECAIKPKRAKKIEWFYEGAAIQQGDPNFMDSWLYPGGVLMLSPVGSHHFGLYSCEATDWSGNTIKAVGYLEDKAIECAGMMVETPLNRTLKAGRPVLLNCMADNADSVTWYKDGQLIPLDDAKRRTLTYGQLLLPSISKQDAGEYECVAKRGSLTCAYKSTIRVFVNADEICGLPVLNQPIPLDTSTRQTGFIVAGNDAPLGSSPWQAMLWFKGNPLPRNKQGQSLNRDFCGGVLIDDQWVVTAAHCIVSLSTSYSHQLQASEVMVRLGKRSRVAVEQNERNVSVVKFVKKGFQAATFDNDIALLKLAEHVEFSDHIRPICLGNATMNTPHRDALITGWGRVSDHGRRPRILQQVTVPIRNRTECRRSTSSTITTNMFCAGEGRYQSGDSCKGDSGGPLSVREGRKWYLLGLVSWGEGCARPGSYGFYTKVTNYKPWLQQTCRT